MTTGYEKIRFYEIDAISRHGLDLPTFVLETMGVWLVPPEPLMDDVRKAGLDAHSGLRAIGYATRMLLPLFFTCDTLDFSHTIGSVNSPWNAIFIYERYPHGLGFTEKVYEQLPASCPPCWRPSAPARARTGARAAWANRCAATPYGTWNVARRPSPSKQAALMILHGLLGDWRQLDNPDTVSLTGSDAGDQTRLEIELRRRLERMREPRLFHPIEPLVKTEVPAPEPTAELPKADVERRIERRDDFNKKLRQRLAAHKELDGLSPTTPRPGPPPGLRPRGGANTPADFPVPPEPAVHHPTSPRDGRLPRRPGSEAEEGWGE